MHFNYMTYHNG